MGYHNLVGVHHVQTPLLQKTTTVLHIKRSIKLCKRLLLLAHIFEAKANVKNFVHQKYHYTPFIQERKKKKYFSSSATMDLKVFLVFTLYVFLIFAKESLSHSTNNLGT